VGGAFPGLDKIIESRIGRKSIGFVPEEADPRMEGVNTNPNNIFSKLMPEDLLKFGMIPEFIGRLPVFTSVNGLDRDALVRVLTEPRNALIRQYQRLFELDGVELDFTPEALVAIADQAALRGTGARGLRAIMEEVLLNVMYDVPSRKDIGRVVITVEVVRDNVNPTLVPRDAASSPRRTRQEKSA
jgi:ATP-dependent Clp protease ATP-binding subunit ClpX